MHCGKCGEQIEDDARFCRHCGAEQPIGREAKAPTRLERKATQQELPKDFADFGDRKRWSLGKTFGGICAAALIFILVLGLIGKSADTAVDNNDMIADNMAMIEESLGIAPGDIPASGSVNSESGWVYSTDEDKLRGAKTYYAKTTSTNSIRQDSPYDGETRMQLTVRKAPGSGLNIIMTISSGQMMCPSYTGCSGTVRFDSAPPQKISFLGAADNSSETIFVSNEKAFLAKLLKSKKLIVEKVLYQAGSPQFEFDVSNLKWDH